MAHHPIFTETIFSEELFLLPQKTVLIFDIEWNLLSDEEQGLLKKILNALNLNLDMVTVHYQPQLNLAELPTQPNHCIYFGQSVAGLAAYEVLEIKGTRLVMSDRLTHLLTHDESKKKLWQALQKQFRK
ncbi:MAG: DNA polymerase III subunit psi [Bacteroidetes bacterium]|nr:DNA polymerase III subunit psi [Bacteroidota bacterium]MBS1541230.1 DNA polymerase III subunit psi [Bacteroidota bacterium]